MGVPRLFATGLWLAVTAAATAMVWAVTSTVAADVTDRPAPVIAHREVVNELASGPTPTTAPPQTSPPSTAAPPRAATTTVAPRSAAAQPPVTPVPTAPPTTAKASPAPSTTTTTAPSTQPTATYATDGGVVRVACNGVFITLLSAIPANGFATNVVSRGPAYVEVHFVRPGQDLSVKAVCFGSPIRYYGDFPTKFPSMAS